MILVVGLGNPLRSDDGAGAWVAGRLTARLPQSVRPRVEIRLRPQLLPEMAEELNTHDAVLLLDAAEVGPRVSLRRISATSSAGSPSSHHLTAEALAGLAQRLWGRPPEMYLISIRGERFDLGEGLSPSARHRANRALSLAVAFLTRPTWTLH